MRVVAQLLFWGACALVGPYLFFRGLRAMRFRRMIANAPRSSARGAALGFVEVSGKSVGPYTIVAPGVNVECLYYRMCGGGGEMCAPLFLEDETGRLMLHPAGSELRVDGYFADEHSEETVGFFIKPGDIVFVFGTLQENRSARTAAGASELSPIGPGFVSKDAAELTWPEGFAPVRYAVESGPKAGPASPTTEPLVETHLVTLPLSISMAQTPSGAPPQPFMVATYAQPSITVRPLALAFAGMNGTPGLGSSPFEMYME